MITKAITLLIIFVSLSAYGLDNDYHQKPLGAEGEKKITFVSDLISKIRLGMDFALRFQSLEHENNSSEEITNLQSGFTNANGNANMDFQLDEGISSYIEIYLSSEHHTEVWMREGYLFIDQLKMLNNPAIDNLMQYLSFKAGQMEINYGDYHFRRTDNGQSVRNPFIGNYIIDANTTEIGVEGMIDYDNWEWLIGVTGGTTKGDTNDKHGMGTYTKLAYDLKKSIDQQFRVSGSLYRVDHSSNPRAFGTPGATQNYLYAGNRSGSPYKNLFDEDTDAGQVLPNISQNMTAYIFNVLWRYGKTEWFFNYDKAWDLDSDGKDSPDEAKESWDQFAVDVKYNFTSKFYTALRYNIANHITAADGPSDEKVNRYQLAFGYFINPSILMKVEYVYQKYEGFQDKFRDGYFHGAVFEGAVSF
jgi:hypothetical protein